jgi:CheY-like chemotaxis protein
MNFDLRASIEEVVDLVAAQAHLKEIEINFLIDKNTPTKLIGDSASLTQVLAILAINAVDFTLKGEILLKATLREETETTATILFAVSDTGIGFSKGLANELSVFLNNDVTPPVESLPGKDLAICHQLVKLMAGEIWLETIEKKGTTFWFTATFDRQTATASPPIMPSIDLQGLRLLLVSENMTTRTIINQQLAEWKVSVDEALNATMAINALSRAVSNGNPYHIALLDMKMSALSGEILGKEIASDPAFSDTKLAIMIFLHQYAIAERLMESGFAASLTKPIKPLTLLHTLVEAGVKLPTLNTQIPTASPQSANQTGLDLNHLIYICEGNREVMQKMLSQFVEDVPPRLQVMRKAIADHDFFVMRQNAHSLKGASATIGANYLEIGARTLEQHASDRDMSHSLDVVAELEGTFNQLKDQREQILQQIETLLNNRVNNKIKSNSPPDLESKSLVKVLLVDDDRMTLTWLHNSLKRVSYYDVTTADSGEAAWNLICSNAFDVIVSDWSMPDMAGIVLCQRLKFSPHLPSATAAFLLLTAFSNQDYQKIASDAGVDDFIIKPVNPETLRAKIDFWTGSRA